MACKMTNNLVQSLHINKTTKVIDLNNNSDQTLIDRLKHDYHVQQMPFVQVFHNDHLIDHWTGFHPDKIKSYRNGVTINE